MPADANAYDAYALDPARVKAPPSTFFEALRYLGPGFVLSASIVGSGELIATTTLGAKAGFVTLWVILVSCLVKVAIQLEFGRHTIQTGQTCMASFNKLPGPKLGKASWTVWLWLLMQPAKILQVGGIVGGVGLILNMAFPRVTVTQWCWLTALVVALLVFWERYAFIERFSLALIGAFTILTLISVGVLQLTPYAITAQDVFSGLQFQLPARALVFAFGAFGLTGVGGDEIMQYNYWLIEKGYAAYTGPPQPDDPAWQQRAAGWTKVIYLDALLSMVVYTIVTAAFYLLGAAVLHARGTVPEGFDMIETLSAMYTESLGTWANVLFLLGGFVVLFSTLFAALAAWTRVFADAFGRVGLFDFDNPLQRRRAIGALAWIFPLLWCLVFLYYEKPVLMVIIGGIVTSLILLLVVFAALIFRYRSLPQLKPSFMYDAAFFLSAFCILALAVYGTVRVVQENWPA